jgi:hypothetical protein
MEGRKMKTAQKSYTRVFLIAMFAIFPIFLFTQSSEDTVAVVLSVSGDVVFSVGGKEFALSPSVVLTKTSVIALKKGAKTGKVQIGTIDGPIVFKKFPVKLDSIDLKTIPGDMRDNYIASIGGTILRSKGPEAKIFEWSTDLGALDASDVEKGFSVVVSQTKSSAENFSLNPLYFKLKAGIKVKSGSYKIVGDTTGVFHAQGTWSEKDGDLAFSLDSLEYENGVDYRVHNLFTLADGTIAEWSFVYTIYKTEDVSYVEAEVWKMLAGMDRDFDKKILRAGRYQSYNFKLKALSILKDAGIDIEGMF